MLKEPIRYKIKMDLFEEIKQIVSEQLGVKPEEVKPAASFKDDLGADSLDAVELIMTLEEKFGIEISDIDAEMMLTVNDVLIAKKNKELEGKSCCVWREMYRVKICPKCASEIQECPACKRETWCRQGWYKHQFLGCGFEGRKVVK